MKITRFTTIIYKFLPKTESKFLFMNKDLKPQTYGSSFLEHNYIQHYIPLAVQNIYNRPVPQTVIYITFYTHYHSRCILKQ